ncbi:Protein of unknown function [Syntrophus gentianae]|uniref:DUF3313 domain-containing protein n=1 Tax=Syntrophus gentianae TaxID=43775 RepID=A0A1H7VX32_9BACT|nr:DUF3313 domain-containing protein [Syntrophus gentianae]SEM13813.1 Protein of unknown function [Syntrophus gentianae]
MKTLAKVLLAVGMAIMFTVSVAMAGDPPFSGFLGSPDVYKQLTPGPEGGAKLRWVKPGADLSKYNSFMVDSVVFYLADQSEYKGIDPQVMKDLADSFNKELVAAFKDKYPIVADPGPDVARIKIAITNVERSKPGVSAITSIVPVGIAISVVKRGATGGWSGSGETCAEFMVLDSASNEALVMAVDQQKAAFASRFSSYGSAEDAFKFWSARIVTALDEAKGIKREPAK